ncbi:uncharacterized protein LOC126969622 [Leptidea sinapis]|uniref:uncharacterized protein LOC126969622 n=1 Tax=Leptidea sinapis TaxID=189913 RepID=UPI0021C4775D|nr:uncharacterized protein LOC126969622 [Leptidea sinapis]
MSGREGVRSSARLSGAAASTSNTVNNSSNVGKAQREAAAALRRARAARAVERSREVEDSPRVLRDKCRQLAKALQEAKHLVVYTGAGISTAADIPDYRGPQGVWTRLQRGESVGRVEVSRARPTYTHMALTALWRRGSLKFVVSQNCDGLHVRAGLPRRALAELHGDMFAERCAACRRVYLRAFDTTERTARHAHATRRLCHDCGRELRDTIVHFGERGRAAWPLNWAGALRHAAAADVVLCLGSSLKVLRRYPRLWRMQRAPHARPALYIVNLQWTPKDAVAALKINARCDAVMRHVARRLRLRVPRYDARADPLLAHAEPLAEPEAHTSRRAPAAAAATAAAAAAAPLYYPLSSPSDSASSDDEVPLCRLVKRVRPRPCPPLLRSFRVSMCAGDATILLRAEHAPAEAPPPPPEPPPLATPTTALRQFRIRRPIPNGTLPHINGTRSDNFEINTILDKKYIKPDLEINGTLKNYEIDAAKKRIITSPMEISSSQLGKSGLDVAPYERMSGAARLPNSPDIKRKFIINPEPSVHINGVDLTNACVTMESKHDETKEVFTKQIHLIKPDIAHAENKIDETKVDIKQINEHLSKSLGPEGIDKIKLPITSCEKYIDETKPSISPEKYEINESKLVISHCDNVTNVTNLPVVNKKLIKASSPATPDKQHDDPTWVIGSKLRKLLEFRPKTEPEPPESDMSLNQIELKSEEEPENAIRDASASLAAAIIRRAVLMCRAHLYSGLHTIITPVPVAPSIVPNPSLKSPGNVECEQKTEREWMKAECDWCARRYASRRCLWYGPPRLTPLERRAWRREQNRRYLCGCCGDDGAGNGGSDSGWYGKGYRKGRRKRR